MSSLEKTAANLTVRVGSATPKTDKLKSACANPGILHNAAQNLFQIFRWLHVVK